MKKAFIVFLMFAASAVAFGSVYYAIQLRNMQLEYSASLTRLSISASTATVVSVRDGDTIMVDIATLTNVPVRLLGVDTPEDVDPREPVQYFSIQAAQFTKKLLSGQRVYLEFGKSKYGVFHRLLAYVWIKPNKEYIMFNALLIINGYGKYYPKYKFNAAYMKLFGSFESYARKNRLGMWNLPQMVSKAATLAIVGISYNEMDEYVQIENVSAKSVNLKGWKMTSVPADKQHYTFGSITLKPKESVFVHSGPLAGKNKLNGINLIWTKRYIWNNSGDICMLFDPSGKKEDSYKY